MFCLCLGGGGVFSPYPPLLSQAFLVRQRKVTDQRRLSAIENAEPVAWVKYAGPALPSSLSSIWLCVRRLWPIPYCPLSSPFSSLCKCECLVSPSWPRLGDCKFTNTVCFPQKCIYVSPFSNEGKHDPLQRRCSLAGPMWDRRFLHRALCQPGGLEYPLPQCLCYSLCPSYSCFAMLICLFTLQFAACGTDLYSDSAEPHCKSYSS